jgi:Tol biopolymer transport system component
VLFVRGKNFVNRVAVLLPGVLVLAVISSLGWGCTETGQPEVVSRISLSTQFGGGDASSHDTSITPDGRYAVFNSKAANLLGPGGDTNGVFDIYLKDIQSGSFTRVSTTSSGGQADGDSHAPSISDDGRFVAFISTSGNLVSPGGGTSGIHNIYLKDLRTGIVSLVSANPVGAPAGDGNSDVPTISADGRYVAFCSVATNLVPGDTNGVMDVFLRDTVAGTTTRVSTSSAGGQGNGPSGSTYGPYLSGNGRFVAFESDADNLIGDADTNHEKDIFVKEVETGATTRVSTAAAGEQANSSSYFPSISADGRYVVFRSTASNLAEGDTLICEAISCSDVFRKDTQTGEVYWVSTTAAGDTADRPSWDPHLSADGRYAAFSSDAANLAIGDGNNNYDIFVKDMDTGQVVLVSQTAGGQEGNDWSIGPFVGMGGAYVVFESMASNLAADDTNGATDAFLSTTGFAKPATEPPDADDI